MKTLMLAFGLLCPLLLLPAVSAVGQRSHPSRYGTAHQSARRSSSGSRPYYGGGHHITSHGGNYPGETNAHHRNGHYQNWKSANRYGIHQAR